MSLNTSHARQARVFQSRSERDLRSLAAWGARAEDTLARSQGACSKLHP
jgi:hypothetical protein